MMLRICKLSACLVLLLPALVVGFATQATAQDISKIEIKWDKVQRTSQTSPTLQIVPCPPVRPGGPARDNAYKALRDLGADYVRYAPWYPYPKLGVAELDPPKDGKTSWDFSLIDPMMIDFLEATKGHPIILNFSTIPQWMFKTDKPVVYPADPNQLAWDYEQGAELRDPSFKEVADYFARFLSWYTKGGFTDEFGQQHVSGYHYSIPYWEVLNEVELEHQMSPQMYTRLYDEVANALLRVDPNLKFVGIAAARPSREPEFFEYFLDPKNHKPGVPLDFISYHFYAEPRADQAADAYGDISFAQAYGFLNTVRYVEAIRSRLSPKTRTTLDELGVILPDDLRQSEPGYQFKPISNSHWNLSGALYAYLFGELTRMGIDVVGQSGLISHPMFFPSVSMVDWNNGRPNARFRILELLHSNFGPGDKLVEFSGLQSSLQSELYALPVTTRDGKERVLLVNKSVHEVNVTVAGAARGTLEYVDESTGSASPAMQQLESDTVKLKSFAVAAVTLP